MGGNKLHSLFVLSFLQTPGRTVTERSTRRNADGSVETTTITTTEEVSVDSGGSETPKYTTTCCVLGDGNNVDSHTHPPPCFSTAPFPPSA